jgi:hypothetical protein
MGMELAWAKKLARLPVSRGVDAKASHTTVEKSAMHRARMQMHDQGEDRASHG